MTSNILELLKAANERNLTLALGFGVALSDRPDGEIKINIDLDPAKGRYDHVPALRDFMEETAVAWLSLVAPHRLNHGSDY